nr:hypothetical protein [Tanacetum cinerariifolium]
MRDLEPKNPDSTLPPKGSNEFIKPKRSTRNSIAKASVHTGMKISRKVSFKVGKGNVSIKDMEGLVCDKDVSDGGGIRDEVTEKEIQVGLEKEMQDVIGEIANNTGNVSKHVGSVNVNSSSLGPVPVPFEENDILNPRKSPVTSPRILKRDEPLNDGGHNANATFSFNNVKKWPSLGNLGARRSGVYGDQDSRISDEVMGENVDVRRTSSFVNVVQGMRSSGNNKLKRIPVTTNELGKKVVNLDHVLEEGSKAWVRTLVGYFVGLKMSHREILGHLRRMWRDYNLGEGIMNDSGKIGNPIIMDRITTSMCENAYGRASFARVLIEVDANNGLVDNIEACYISLGRSMMLKVEYLWKPPICSHCKVNTQSNANVSNVEKSGAEWQTVNNRRYNRSDGMNGNFYGKKNSYGEGSSRGGFGDRGRGTDGRGYGDQRYGRNENAQYVQVKKVNAVVENSIQGNKDNGKMKNDVNVSSFKDKKQVGNKGIDIDGSSSGKGNSLTQNQAYGKVYDEVYRDELDRIKEMKLKLQLAEVELFFKTRQVFSNHELETWTEEKLEFYESSISKEAFENMRKQINVDRNEDMGEEVAEDRSGCAIPLDKVCDEVCGVWEWVSNNLDSCKGCRIVVGWDPRAISATLLAQTDQAVHFLVRTISDNKKFYVMLGDFNVILRVNENSNEIVKRKCPESDILKELYRIMGNSHFITSYPSSFATFMPYLTFDHCLTILMQPDVSVRNSRSFRFMNFLADKKEFLGVVSDNWEIGIKGFELFKHAKKLKGMKKHIRSLNRINGDVFEKVKVIKAELSSVQEELDKDPNNASHREVEMLFYHAYKEAALDEEKLLQKKTKIEWLREGDFNSAFFYNSLKGRTNRNRIEMVYDDQENAVYGELDVENAIDLIKLITNNEVKDALVSIEDKKAVRPYGYSSKFFKDAWSVIGKDVCSAAKEFFTSGKMLGEFNTTLISLVPKLKSPARVTDYRPISCCNVIYKIISKIITNRLKPILGDLVDVNQSVFIPVSWEFLDFSLKEFGFHPVMVHWIMVCLKAASFSVCVNGESKGFFKARRGLRQGDPTSPYLFTLVMEVLNLMVKRQIRNDKRFSMSSRLYPSEAKSEAFFSCLTPEVKEEIKLVMLFREGSLPIRYLGVPLSSKSINKMIVGYWLRLCRIRVVWIDKKGREIDFKVSEVWKGIRIDSLKVTWSKYESHSHIFFSCAFSKKLWERLNPMAMMDNISNIWPSVISSIVNKPANNTIWSVIQSYWPVLDAAEVVISALVLLFSCSESAMISILLHLAGSQPMLKSSYKADGGVIISIPPLVGGVKGNKEKDKIGIKPDKNGRRGKARQCQRPITVKKAGKEKKIQVQGTKQENPRSVFNSRQTQGVKLQFYQSYITRADSAICSKMLYSRTSHAI